MIKYLQYISRWLATYTSFFIILIAVVAFFFPESFAWVQQGQRASIILGLIMLTMGCTLSTQDFVILLQRPLDILIGTLAQFTIMPLVAWTLSQAFHLDPYMAVGIILVGSCPGGVSSNIMSFLCHGDVAFSVGMTTVSTLLAPFVTPLLVLWLAGAEINVDAWGMFQNILIVTILPITAGILLNYVTSLWMYATPIIYPLSTVTDPRLKIAMQINPVTSIFESFKYGFLGAGEFSWNWLAYSFIVMVVLLLGGILIFNQKERNFMDTV